MAVTSKRVARIGTFLVQLARLEQAQNSDVFVTDRIEATADRVMLRLPTSTVIALPIHATTSMIAAAAGDSIPDLHTPAADQDLPWSTAPSVARRWAQLHYALGAFESVLRYEADMRILDVERHGKSALVRVLREPTGKLETYSIDLDHEIDFALTTTIALSTADSD